MREETKKSERMRRGVYKGKEEDKKVKRGRYRRGGRKEGRKVTGVRRG